MEATVGIRRSWAALTRPEPLAGAYFWLLVFFFVYCARPEDWIPGLAVLPVAKISGIFALLALLLSLGGSKRGLLSLPREVFYLLVLDGYLLVGGLLSPVWRGGAVNQALDFSKALVAVAVTILAVTSLERLRRLILVQTGSVVLIGAISMVKGRGQIRLQGVLNGMYGNPNDLAFAIALVIPFCFAFMVATRSIVQRAAWAGATLILAVALMRTGSRGGIITFAVAGVFCLWRFAVRGRRPLMVLGVALVAILLFVFAGSTLKQRFAAISGENITTDVQGSAYASYEQRRFLIDRSLQAIGDHPIFGIGAYNFTTYSGQWREVHVTLLQIAAEGGIPALILFLMFFWRGFRNLRVVARTPDLDSQVGLFAAAVAGSLIAYVVGAQFAPEAYQFFPLFAVAYTSVLVVIAKEPRERTVSPEATPAKRPWRTVNVYTDTSRSKPQLLVH
ncbi:MAG TPA: O-antigen ligase family protein [Terriglobia bacterium]|nr:O-antigen ligase family protein [Terriglobia bacterium]